MSLLNALKILCRIPATRNILSLNKRSVLYNPGINLNQVRGLRFAYAAIQKVMKVRRKIVGPDKMRKRSDWLDWNYDAEIYAFNKRLHENVSDETLRCVFIHDSYIQMEEQKRKDMSVQDAQLNLKSNSSLSALGEDVMSKFLLRYLRVAFQYLPEEGIRALHDYLISDDVLSHVSYNLGTKELIFCAEYPPSSSTLATTFKAFVGGITSDDSVGRAENFVLDFVCPQLIGKDVFDIWEPNNPLQVLNNILKNQGREPTESRLLFESGRHCMEAVFHVGLYSDKQFLGRGVGETLTFAEEMAAFDVLRRLFHLTDSKPPLPLGNKARTMNFDCEKENPSLDKVF